MKMNNFFLRFLTVFGLTMAFAVSGWGIVLDTDTFDAGVDGWSGSNVVWNSGGSGRLFMDRDDAASKTFSFGSGYANQQVEVTLDATKIDTWEGGERIIITANSATPYNSNTAGTISFNATLNGSGQLVLSVLPDTDANAEDLYIDNISITYIPSPEINVVGIADGGTDSSFGTALVAGGMIDKTYTIQNTGSGDLTIGVFTVTGDFALQTAPAATVTAGTSTTFTLRFDPSALGNRTGTVSFVNNDSNENPYDFSVSGTGDSPPIMGDVPNQTATVGASFSLNISSYVILTNSDPITAYTLTGSLPAGLSFNTSTGVISGTPTTGAAAVALSVTATDNDGVSNSDSFTLTVATPTVATTQDLCYDTVQTQGFSILGLGLFYGVTTPIRNISNSSISNATVIKSFDGIDISLISAIKLDNVAKTIVADSDQAEINQNLQASFGALNLGGIFDKGAVYRIADFSANEIHTIYDYSTLSLDWSRITLDAIYNKNGTYYSAQISACPVEIGWEQLTYETSENTALTYGDSSQMPMRITIDHAVDYPINVSFTTHDGTAIGDSDYRISNGTVTIPAGETSVTINMDIYHDEAIELTEEFTVTLSNPTGSGGVILKPNFDVATVRIMEQNTAPICYSDNFNTGTAIDNNWRVLQNQGITPGYVNGKMRLTDLGTHQASAITKDFQFPSSGNIIITEFTYYSYGGSGADGIGFVLYDSEVGASPWVGVTGGSLGYAQGSNVYTACQPNGCPGFEGGWLGLGLDEYGNYSNPNEGRTGTGTNSGFHADAASIRGKGNSADGYMSGYTYLAGTGTMATSLDRPSPNTAPMPGDKYRMTVDARDSAHLYISLERMIGGVGTYQTIINQFDAIASQGASPDFVRLALTGSTGGSTNIHEIDNMTVWGRCTPYNPSTDNPTAVGFDARETSISMLDNNRPITTKIVNKPTTLNVISLNSAGGLEAYSGVSNNRVYLFEENNATCSLSASERLAAIASKPKDWYVTFNQNDTNKITPNHTPSTASKDKRIMMNFMNWSQAFTDANFNCSNSNSQAVLKGVPQCLNSNTKLAQVFPTLVAECLGGLKPACESNSYASGNVPTAPYNNDYGCYQCLAGGAGATTCSTDNFAIRPEKLVINSTHAHMPVLLRAGEDYNVSINAYNYNTTTNTADYNVSAANTVFTTSSTKYNRNNVVTPSMGGALTFANSDFNMSNGISVKSGVAGNQVAGLTFSDVGKINVQLIDKVWSAVDNDDTPQDCSSTGTWICGDKNVTFIPDHFDFNELNITNNNGNPGTFTYLSNEITQMGGRIHTQIRALNKTGNVTQNFALFPLWENPISVTPVVRKSTYLYPDANETTIINLAVGFGTGSDANGTKTIEWNETNTSQYLRFNFKRDVNQIANFFDVNGTELNISITSHYVDGGNSADINGIRNGTASGGAHFVYGRFIPRDVRVFGQNPFTAIGWYEVFNSPTLGATLLTPSKNENMWYINQLHDDATDGDANIVSVLTATNTALPLSPVSNGTGMESYQFTAEIPPYSAKAHIAVSPWLWYGPAALTYTTPGTDCSTHPCFNINVVPSVGATGSSKDQGVGSKTNKSTSGGTGWKSTRDYAPAIR